VKTKVEFAKLLQEFVSSYPYTPEGLRHRTTYEEQRQQRRRKFEAISATFESGEDLTEPILYLLFPDKKLSFNLSSDCSAETLEISGTLETYLRLKLVKEPNSMQKWAKEIVEKVGQAILDFVVRCNDNPSQLIAACNEFYKQEYCQRFPVEMIISLLNALRPDEFLLINKASLQVINYFANTSYSQKLIDYPVVNIIGRSVITKFSTELHQPGVPALRDDDLFDMFCYWLINVKKNDFIGNECSSVNKVIEVIPNAEKVKFTPKYPLTHFAVDSGFEEVELNRWIRAIERKKQAIFYGSPGTGKTYIAEHFAKHLISSSDGFKELVQFHPAYSYEDFIQGIRPQSQDGQLAYPLVPGRFLEFCKKAESREGLCVLIIDEINRANLAQVFGELMYLLEYRDKKIRLVGSNELFSIPENVRIIGTMNTADRSIALVDHALRRRFAFIELRPNYEVLRRYHEKKETGFPVDGLIETLKRLNNAIADKHYEVGISYFLTENLAEELEDIWQMEIEPYLEEYFYDQLDKVDEFRWDKIRQQVSP
jgi:5-methylcytosine-specific restriction protein B